MQFDLISWIIGIPTGIGINWLSQWLYHLFLKKLQPKGDYFTATYSKDFINFEGHVKARVSAEEVIHSFLEPTKQSADKTKNVKADDLFAIPEALRALTDLDIETVNKLSLVRRPNSILADMQLRLRKDWGFKPNQRYDNLSVKEIQDAIKQTTKRLKLKYTSVNEETISFMLHIAGILDDKDIGLSTTREADECYKRLNILKTKVTNKEILNAIRVYNWYSLGINSILLFIAYFPPDKVQEMMRKLGKTSTELKKERDDTLAELLINVNILIKEELLKKS